MRLFLSGGGSGEKSKELDKKFASALNKSKSLLYIPIAMDEGRHPYSECLQWIRKTFVPLGVKKIEMCTEGDLRKLTENDLERFSGVYIGGGNTFYLLKELRESKFLPKLERIIKKGISVYGGSAGAIICAKTIIPATPFDNNDVGLKNLNAMNLVRGFDLWCHYDVSMDKQIKEYQKKYHMNLIALPEDCGLYVSERNIEIIGPGSAYIVSEKMKLCKALSFIRFK